ncbi:MAG: hypothetical protein H7039_07855, partial [Bryobacteraceae bacterium]|nr:hypothetical protein [Bryobacteraceae bacterium]
MFGIPAGFIIGAVLIELALLRISAAGGLTRDVPALILTLIWAQTIYIVTVYLVWREKGRKPPVLFIIGVALAFRCTVWPLTSPLSTDLYRYRWEGQVQHNGGNPYSERPGDPEWIGLRDSVWSEVGQKDVRAGYGPAWELISAGMYRLAAWMSPDPRQQVFWFKLPAALSDLGLLGVLWATLRSRDLPTELL